VPQDFAKRRQNTAAKKPAAHKVQARRREEEESQPRGKGFRLFMTGVLTGMFLSLLIYLNTLPKPTELGAGYGECAATRSRSRNPQTAL